MVKIVPKGDHHFRVCRIWPHDLNNKCSCVQCSAVNNMYTVYLPIVKEFTVRSHQKNHFKFREMGSHMHGATETHTSTGILQKQLIWAGVTRLEACDAEPIPPNSTCVKCVYLWTYMSSKHCVSISKCAYRGWQKYRHGPFIFQLSALKLCSVFL